MADAERGALAYIGDGGSVRGREEWTLSVAPDGSRLLRSSCWIFDTRIERHVVTGAPGAGVRSTPTDPLVVMTPAVRDWPNSRATLVTFAGLGGEGSVTADARLIGEYLDWQCIAAAAR